jgi:predicted ABC-type ATPase
LPAHQIFNSFSHELTREQISKSKFPRCVIVAGPNGGGKTTFAREFLPKEAGIVHFVNAGLLAAGLSPLQPRAAAVASGKLLIKELDRLGRSRVSFAFESTLSGLRYVARIKRWKAAGYRFLEITFASIGAPPNWLGLSRVAMTSTGLMFCEGLRENGKIL